MLFFRRSKKSRQSRPATAARKFVRRLPLSLERLEGRILLSADNWIAGSGNWDVGSNWSLGHAPGSGDTAVINTSGAATVTIQSGDGLQVQSVTSGSNDTLSFTGGSLTVTSGTSTLSGALSMTGGNLIANGSGANLTANGTTTISGANLYVEGGATLSLPQLINYTADNNTFEASGTGSVLDVSALTTPTLNNNWSLNAYNGGTLKLTGLTSLSGNSLGRVYINDTGSSSLVDSNVTTLSGVIANIASDAQVANSWTQFTNGQLQVSGGSYNLSGLTDVDGSNLYVESGGSLALPGLVSYVANNTTFEANSTGSVLDVSALTTPTLNGNWSINAYNGAKVKLTGLTSLSGNSSGGVYINDTGNSTLLDSNVTTLTKVNVNIANDAQVANSWTKFTNGQLTVSGGSYNLAGLTDVDGSNVTVTNGATLALSGLNSYVSNNNTFEANGAGSVLDVSKLTTLTQQNSWSINAYNGGVVKLSGLTSLTSTNGVYFNLSGSGSTVDLLSLTSLTGTSNFSITNGATLNLPVFTTGHITLGNGSQLTIQGVVVSMPKDGTSGATITVPSSQGLVITLQNTGKLTNTTINVGQGTTVALAGGTYLGATALNVAQGATVDLTGGSTTNYGGTLTGSGSGTVQFINSALNPTVGGLTLNFPGSMFQWTGGAMFASLGNVTNRGTINLGGSSDKGFYEDATFYNYGTIIQTGTGNLGLHSDNVSPTTFINEAGASYLIESDSGIDNPFGGQVAVQNAGTIEKTAGTGTSTLLIDGLLNNTGTIEADSGTLNLEPNTIAQLGSTAVSYAGPVTTNIYSSISGTSGSGAPYSNLVGTLTTNSIVFGSSTDWNWHPFNLSEFGADSTGSLSVAAAGTYTFSLEPDDGGKLFIDGNLVVDDGGQHYPQLLTGKATLTAGLHTFEVQFFENGVASSGLDMYPPLDTLTGGTWKALNGATLQFPSGTSITTNNANISLDGSKASISALAALNSNKGSLSLTNGASFTTTADLTNSGSLTFGTGSTFTVKGNYTQTASGALNVQLGGTPASGSFGQLAVQNAANLGGNFNVSLVNGFTPSSGQDFKALTYTNSSGAFATVTGLNPFFTLQLNPTTMDLVNVGTNAVSLQLGQVTAPTTATTGQQITVNWQVSNPGSIAATGSWQDSVYLSTTPSVTGNSILLGSATHNGGLAANASYNGTLTAAVPVLPPGNYYVLVQADSLYQVPVADRTNDIAAASTGQFAVSVPALTLGNPKQGTFTAANQDQYYQVTVPAGGTMQVTLTSTATAGALGLYVSQGAEPTTYNYQYAGNLAGQPNQSVTVPVTDAGTYYILVHSIYGNAASGGYTLTVTQSNALSVTAISSYSGGNAGNATVEIDGTNFTPQTTAKLTLGSTTINASAIDFESASKLFATFNLSGATPGGYTLSVQQGNQTATAASPFQVVASTAGNGMLDLSVTMSQLIRAGRTGTVTITYTNKTNNDIIAPLLEISSQSLGVKSRPPVAVAIPGAEAMAATSGIYFSTPDDPNNFVQQAQLLAVASDGPAGILRPGQSGQLTLTLLTDGTGGSKIPVAVQQVLPGQTIDWASQKAGLQPAGVSNAAWNVIFNNVQTMIGSTTDSYRAALGQAATYLGSLGETPAQVSDVSRLFAFLVAQANDTFPSSVLASTVDAALPTPGKLPLSIGRTFSSTLSGRYQEGIFGMGWTTPLESSLATDSAGNATITTAGVQAYFFAGANGSYLGTGGVQGTLTSAGGVFTYTDPTGMQYVFLGNGKVNYEQDTNGNRITFGYNAQNQLTGLTYSNSSAAAQPTEQLALSYNSQGLVSGVADGTGNTWTYTYDSAGHLLSVKAPGNLTTSYTYDTGSNPETANALLSITYPNGSQVNYTYDPSSGRLSGISRNGGTNPITYTYSNEAEVTSTDAAGNTSTVWFNDDGAAGRVEDGLGNITNYAYNANGNLISSTDAAGGIYQYSYDMSGNLVQTINPLGQTVQMTYGSLHNLTSQTDAAGNTTQYKYDSAGNLLSITYPDATQKSFTYDPLGNLSETVLQNGDPINYQYNAQGLVSLASFADGSSQSFTHDGHGNLLTANSYDSGGSLSGTTTLTYNAANQLLTVTYPNGQSLTFTYNTRGQRIKSVDQSGFTINYSYDTLGRLSKLTDGSGNLIVQYSYNNIGQLQKKVNGNGTYTTYQYDASGNLTSLVNYADAAGKTVNSSFTYTYNSLNEETSVTDAANNVTKYGYDAIGQLTSVSLPGGTSIRYTYNAAGDRTQVVTNGTPISYTSNNNNEILQVGSTAYTYDKNGNLSSATNASGTTTYTYNDRNQLVSITNPDGSVQTFQYSPLGYLVGTTTTSGDTTSQTNFLVDPSGLGNVVASYNGSGSLIADYTYGLGLVSQTGPGGSGSYDFDGSGNTVGITGSNGAYVNQYSYLPFGETTTVSATLPNPFTFAGQSGVMQIGTGPFSMRAREYAPTVGQFLSNDPLGLAGGDPNIRRYVGNNPISFVDPEGLQLQNGQTIQSGQGINTPQNSNMDLMNHNNYDPGAYHGDNGGSQQTGGQQTQTGGQAINGNNATTGNLGGFQAVHNSDGSWDLYPITNGQWNPNGPHYHIPKPHT